MIQDMKTTLTRLLMVIMLMIFSMGAKADVKVIYGEKGTEKFEGSGGKIEVTQKESDDKTQVTVYLTVTPDNGYTMAKDGIELYATIPANAGSTRAPEVSTELTPKCDDFKDGSQKRTYYVKIASNLALWVKSASFQKKKESGAKAGTTPSENTDYSGVFYFANGGSGKTDSPADPLIANITDEANYYYLVPADAPQQPNNHDAWYSSGDTNGNSDKPYLTTYRTNKDAADVPPDVTNRPHNSVWIVEYAGYETVNNTKIDYYYLIHAATGKYVVYEPPFSTNNNRKSVHLLATDSPGENAKFAITLNSGNYNFRPKSVGTGTNDNKYLNPSNRNFNYYYSSTNVNDGSVVYYEGLIGLWKDKGKASDWKPEATILDAPTISAPDANNKVTIADANSLPSGYEIRYTTDGSTPTATTGEEYSGPISITASVTIKAVVVRYDMVLTEVASETREPVPCATPVITFDYTNSKVSIECATDGSTIFYSTDGGNPTTEYSVPFSITGPTTIKAKATRENWTDSEVGTLTISQVATPTIQNNGSNAISITTTLGATIYYTTDGSTPAPGADGTFEYTDPLTENVSNVTIKAIAVKENMITSAVGSGKVMLQCATPVITRDGMKFTLSCSFPTDANLYYTLDGGSEVTYTGEPVSFTTDQLPMTVTAVARHSNYTESETASFELLNGSGTPDDPYLIYSTTDFTNFVSKVNAGTTSSACYKLEIDVSGSNIGAITAAFTGTFDGGMHTISGLDHALFNTVNGGVVKNVILDNVGINGGTNVGAICNEATGASRIYNCGVLATGSTVEKDEDGYDKITSCSSTISGSGFVGGIVGLLDGSSRVINCFSYANVSGGSEVGGIVGHNNVATTASNLQTMVMNCMFYGEVSGGSIAPIYNGAIITNDGDADGVNNFNYFRLESSYIQNTEITKVYNCALGAETRFLQRFEFFRHLLNSNRELAAWWASKSTTTVTKEEMMKWVLEPTQIGTTTPYPILKTPGKYASVVNYTPSEIAYDETNRNKGRKLTSEGNSGVLHVTIDMGTNGGSGAYFSAPSGAGLKSGETGTFDLTITDKDFEHFNFNYGKVQLPYYNDYCVGNYTGNRVVTGWKITSITGGTAGTYSTGDDVTYTDGVLTATPYNFADRKCTNKDLYSVSGRVFNQGAYWDVPEGVKAITIEPYWGKAVYLADAYWDVIYKNGSGNGTAAGSAYDAMTTAINVPNVGGGQHYENGKKYNLATHSRDDENGQIVYTSISGNNGAIATAALYEGISEDDQVKRSVYDYAVVLVGNYHFNGSIAGGGKPYTVTSVDLDGDNEPDYSFILRFNGRTGFHPVRYDFLNLIGLGMAQKTVGGTGSYNFGIMQPKYWFEVTNTALFRVTQFEYSQGSRVKTPYILQGGVIEQWVTQQQDAGDRVSYFHVGGNVWFKEFHRGSHQDNDKKSTPHPPLSVTGGDFAKFYLTGLYQAKATIYDDNAECYINGGRFGEVAGAGMEGIGTSDGKGNITWIIDNADIKEFYGGGINYANPVHGNIHTIISNSHVDIFCGGPKFGDMESGRTVTTTATNCTFGTYFGAGYGGNSYNRVAPRNHNNMVNFPHSETQAGSAESWDNWLEQNYKQSVANGGVSTQFDYQFLPMSSNTENVARIFVDYVAFSLATTHDVTSSLTGCTITGNFYGGGSLGMVDGNVTSTLTDCSVNGSVFGAGYKSSQPTVEVMDIRFQTEPYYYEDLGTYRMGVFPTPTTTYRWKHGDAISIDKTNHILYTTEDLTTLGQVTGKVTTNITGNTLVKGNVFQTDINGNVLKDAFGNNVVKEQSGGVFGGGDASAALGNTEVNIYATGLKTGYAYNAYNVFGGGNLANVGGSVTVNMRTGTVAKDVYGGGALANTNNFDTNQYEKVEGIVPNVTIVTGLYTKSGETYTEITAANQKASADTDYYRKGKWVTTLTSNTTTVNLLGGTINGDAYGGGLGRIAITAVTGVHYTQEEIDAAQEGDPAYGKTTEDWKVEPVTGVEAKEATVYGDINVYLGGDKDGAAASATAFTISTYDGTHSDVVKSGRVFGANNLNGSPQGNVTVTVYKTVKGSHDKTPAGTDGKAPKTVSSATSYRVAAVYGGGNLANYAPTATGKKTHVIINGCDETSIEYVYGGGNAAAVPETDVDINEAYEIGTVFGGGNGKDQYTLDGGTTWKDNAGADVNGKTNTMLYGGTIHEAFGGSNEKGTISGSVYINTSTCATCPLNVGKLYGAGKNADINGDLIMVLGCKEARTEEVYGGAENANVKGNVELTITSGEFGKVFGGNNQSGAIFGHIKLNIQETSCKPIKIDELYLGGNEAAYSIYGYYVDGTNPITGKPLYKPRSAEMHNTATTDPNYQPAEDNPTIDDDHPFPYDDPELNIISCESIGMVFGGGFGEGAALYGNPTVNINQTYPLEYDETTKAYKVKRQSLGAIGGGYEKNSAHVDGGVFGGGNEATVYGNTTVNIGTETSVNLIVFKYDANGQPVVDGDDIHQTETITGQTFNTVLGANIVGNVYGGGNKADVTGNTFVNICAKKGTGDSYTSVAFTTDQVIIGGNVFGGGKGVGDSFTCEKAMVGIDGAGADADNYPNGYPDGNTTVVIGNGKVNGNVYGGGQIGRVEMNTTVTVGLPGSVTSSPDIKGDVFGGGMGEKEHGYAGLVRGNPTVTIQANTKVEHNVYGGGEIASVARYKVPRTDEELAAAHNAGYTDAVKGRPYALKDPNSGFCTVTVQGNAIIGPDTPMKMYHEVNGAIPATDAPDDAGHVFGAGKGIMPENYEYDTDEVGHKPRCRANDDSWTWFADIDEYIAFIQTLALSSQTTVTIGDANDSNSKPFIKGSVYGGSENGLVQFHTNVYINSGQIGWGKYAQNNSKGAYDEDVWADTYVPSDAIDLECPHWDYGKEEGSGDDITTVYAPYDPFANAEGDIDKYPAVSGQTAKSTEGGRKVASDGHTYYGNVFGGGSGSVPYFDTTEGISKYLHSAGTVKGNTNVTISGGHILTSVYGGCEATNVMGTANVTMTGGTVGVPRTDDQILAHPVTCNLFGAGKGDQRVFFNKDTNVNDAVVIVSGGRIYGSVFGGGEDGHIMRNSTVTISGANTKIGTKGTSYMDGNVFGGGRGFGGDALTAGNVGGAVTLNIENGYVLGSVYGGGRLASVGYGLYLTTETGYGEMRADDVWDDPTNPISKTQTAAEFFDKGRGKITINISGGTIGNDVANAEYGGNVFGGSMGSLTKQDGTLNTQWDKFATAKKTTVNVTGGTIKRSVYGGGELGTVTTDAIITVSGGIIGKPKEGSTVYGGAVYGNIYGGGKGYVDPDGSNYITAGIIKGNTYVTVENGSTTVGETTTTTTPTIYHNIYGGGAYGSVGEFTYDSNTGLPTGRKANTTGGTTNITITGGTIGTTGKENGMIFGSSRGDVDAPGSIQDKLAWVYDTHVTIGESDGETTTPLIRGSVYGSGENGHTFNDTEVIVHSGMIGIATSSTETDITENGKTYKGAAYPYRGNVYGGGCGTDMYDSNNDGVKDAYNPLSGIVRGDATIRMTAGHVVHNMYGAGAMGSVGNFEKDASANAITFNSGGTTTIAISGGTIGVDGTAGEGNVYGAARGDVAVTDRDLALVNTTSVTISGSTQIKGNVYGGGEVGNVQTDTRVDVQGGAIAKNVFGGGKGVENLFTCEQAMVGVDGEGAGQDLDSDVNKDKGTIVTISNGTVGTLSGGNLVEGTGNVYGGGEIGRVEWNTQVTIGESNPSGTTVAPIIHGSVFGAGKGLETHGYSALVRGNSTVTVQGNAKVEHNVYGGGEKSTVGRYWVKGINNIDSEGNPVPRAPEAPSDLPDGMPYQQQSGGICSVTIQGSAQIGPNAGASTDAGHVFGAGKGANPHFNASTSKKMTKDNVLVAFEATTGKTAEDLYLEFLQTLALVTNSNVTIDGSATVKGSVYGGSESGFVQHNTDVDILGGTINGDAFGGGLGLASFAEAGKVKGNTDLTVSDDALVEGNVYGGGSLGDVGIIDKTDKKDGQLTYNYKWKQSDGVTANVAEYNIPSSTSIHDTSNNTGICKVTVSGGTIGLSSTNEPSKHGNVFGAGRGSSTTWWCEKAIAYATDVSVTKGTVYGNVYGGGEVGRVEDDAKVTIGAENGTDEFTITGSVFGAGAGLATHGYSALVRGNAVVTVQGKAQISGSVYGGGEIASVGRFHVVGGLPRNPQAGGTCTVKIQGNAKIGTSGTGHNVFGACKGVTPAYNNTQGNANRSKSMQLYENRPKNTDGSEKAEHTYWDYYETYGQDYEGQKFVWVYYETEDEYLDFLKTLALTSNTHVTVGGSSSVYGSVYGGGERGITLGGVDVNMTGGMVNEDVYGGGSLADSNTAMWDATNNKLHDYAELELIPGLSDVTGYYTAKSPDALIETPNAKAEEGTTYYAIYKTNVNLTGGTINGNAYGGGLGRKKYGTSGQDGYVSPIEAMVYGDVLVELNKGIAENETAKGCAVTRVFGCNNLNGTPKGKVKVYVYATQKKGGTSILNTQRGTYDVEAVYGGGNLAAYIPYDATLDYTVTANQTKVDEAYTEVIIDGCKVTSIRQVYGGGNAAPVPASHVEIRRAYEIDEVFGGGNGADNYSLKEGNTDVWYQNPGANVGYYNYTNTTTSESKPGSISSPYYLAPDDEAFDTKDERLADNPAAAALRYGSGIARLEVKGGTIHTSYGGSNSRGNIRVKASSVYSASFDDCPMSVEKSYGGGKNAPIDGEVDMVADCAKGIKQMFGGSENADVDNDINLVITNGSSLERVFGGNNTSGAINGSITVTIEEGGCEPIKIGHLYLGGFLAPYSVYGYKKTNGVYDTEEVEYIDTDGTIKKHTQRIPLESGSERVADPRIIVISATRIDSIFGGGYQAKLVGNPHVNVNMTNGFVKVTKTEKEATDGNTYAYEYPENGKTYIYKDAAGTVYSNEGLVTTTGENTFIKPLEIGTIGTIYGGGNMADIVGDTYVEIGTGTCHNENGDLVVIDRNAATITGNVFGGGKGKADSFKCMKAMVGVENSGSGSTNITIGNGTIEGTVYGGGEIGRVEANTNVTIGLAEDDVPAGLTSLPIIKGNVFGAGRGVHTHGYAALVRGNATVTVQGEAKVRKSVYGGGEIASVGKYNIADAAYHAQHPEVLEGMPYSLVSDNKGICYVTVKDNAVIGPEGSMEMKAAGGPDDIGHVFGAGKGVLPYQDIDGKDITKNNTVDPWRMKPGDIVETFNETTFSEDYYKDLYGAGYNKKLYNYLADYLRFIETLALTTQTEVTVGGNAFVKGSVYGGSENGHVQHNTHVTIQDDCQIGHSKGVSRRFSEDEWDSANPAVLKDCASWDYDANEGAPYDPLATSAGTYDYTNYQFVPAADQTSRPNSDGGKPTATDGHTFYGNVFGGGSGVIPYAPGRWHREAGSVGGNTQVDITGGHIMTSVYGGNEQTDVGTYILDPNNDYQPTIPKSGGKCTINMTGGTVGVPRSVDDMKAHPVTCYVFGAGKGDQRIFFNTWTNVIETEVNISGTARIYGSTFGGGEDGHVINNAVTNISGDKEKVIIGTTGTSYVDGNVFGGGRGFSGEAQTAGTVGGNVEVNIGGGTILGSVYGGGRLASVGTLFTAPDDPNYGNFQEDGDGKTYGHIDVEISGSAIIGNNIGNRESGNVFGGSMGRLELLDGTTINPIWPKMAQVKTSQVTVSGDAIIRRNVYGGGELGTVRDDAVVTISGGTVRRDVYGGGYGSEDFNTETIIHVKEPTVENPDPTNSAHYKTVDYKFTPMIFAGCVGKSTTVNVNGGWIRKSVYGGGEMASVGIINCMVDADGKYLHFHEHSDPENGFVLSWPYHFEYVDGFEGAAKVNVTGGRIGVKDVTGEDNSDIAEDNGDVYGAGKGIAGDYKTYVYCANVGSAEVNINYTSSETTLDPKTYEKRGDCITGAVYGGGENGHVMGDAKLTLQNGLVGHSIYGGGSGKGKFTKWLTKIPEARRSVVTSGGTGTAPNTNANGEYEAECYSITAGKVFGNTRIDMTGGYVIRNVYGGGNMASVGKGNYSGGPDDYSAVGYGETLSGNLWDGGSQFSQAFLNSGKCTVNITGGTVGYIGHDATDPLKFVYPRDYNTGLPYGNVFGGCRGESAPNILESPRYLYCPEFFLGYVNATEVTIGDSNGTGPTILGSVYGGGMDGHVRRDTKVTINGGTIGSEYTTEECNNVGTSDLNDIMWQHRGNVYGAGSGIGKYKFDLNYDGDFGDVIDYTTPSTPSRTTRLKEEDYSTSAGSVTRFTEVIVNGGTIHRNVYGGGSLASVGGPKIPPISTDPIRRDDQTTATQGKQSLNQVVIAGGQIGDDSSFDAAGNHVYGGYVFGASRGEESIENPSSFAQAVWTDVDVTGGTIASDVYGGGEVGSVRQGVKVDLTGGTVKHDVFGGGKGTSEIAADIGGDVTVDVNNVAEDAKGCVVLGSVYGANNVNGTPLGHVLVYVHGTQNENTTAINDKVDGEYDVVAVFGGGKSADYVPTDTKQTTEVIIEGCELTSIEEVYGGGYGAAVPATSVLVKGTEIIDNLYGGGYGAGTDNPGANVGFLTGGTRYASGSGQAIVQLMAGTVHNVYGGSNTKGDIFNGSSVTNVANDGGPGCCTKLSVDEIYGGGKSADMYGGAEICLSCMPNDWIGAIYAGAEEANVGHDISLTLTSGKFKNVYGGNKTGGKVEGSIEVNIEENPECSTPIIIGELYGGGNLAPYSIYGYYQDGTDSQGKPVYKPRTKEMYDRMSEQEKLDEGIHSGPHNSPRVNVRAFTSIGTIFGGGLGESAVMIGNPTVNINVVEGGRAYEGETLQLKDGTEVTLYARSKDGKIGVIGNVFGGGNAAQVIGNTTVNVGTTTEEQMVSLQTTDEQGNVTIVKRPVVGADIRGNVYGGGNNAGVTGNTNVIIGQKAETTTTTPPESNP